MPFLFFDSYYFTLVIPALLLTVIAQIGVTSAYNKYSKVNSVYNKTASQICREILDRNGLNHISVGRVSGNLTDHYDPKKQVINLSDSTYNSTSIAAIGVAAHEAGHACQYAQSYFPIKVRTAIVPVTQFASTIAPYLLILGVLFSFGSLIELGIILFGVSVVFQLVTLPVEFNASRRAMATLRNDGILNEDELHGTKKVLNAAAMTYVAGLALAVASFLRVVLLFGSRRRD